MEVIRSQARGGSIAALTTPLEDGTEIYTTGDDVGGSDPSDLRSNSNRKRGACLAEHCRSYPTWRDRWDCGVVGRMASGESRPSNQGR